MTDTLPRGKSVVGAPVHFSAFLSSSDHSGFDNQERMSLLRCPQFLLWQALRKAFPQDSH
jgi:hypothetical protein